MQQIGFHPQSWNAVLQSFFSPRYSFGDGGANPVQQELDVFGELAVVGVNFLAAGEI